MKRLIPLFLIAVLIFINLSINVRAVRDDSSTTSILTPTLALPPGAYNPQDDFTKNLPFDLSGVTCGIPGSPASKCCSSANGSKISQEDVDSLVKDLTSGQVHSVKQLTPKEKNDLMSLINVSDNEQQNVILAALIQEIMTSPGPPSVDDKKLLENMLKQRANIFNNLTAGQRLKVAAKNQFTNDFCLINGVVHGLCFKGAAEYVAEKVGDNPNIQSIMDYANNVKADQCILGRPVNKGSACHCENVIGADVLCYNYLQGTKEYAFCSDCYNNRGGIWTGIGCVSLTISGFISGTLLGWGVGLAGIIALLCIMYSAFILQTSQGNPERIKKAREYLTNCIIGLLLIIFSIFILRLIGVTILQIPGLS